MASGVNKAIIIGRLGNDPEVRYTSNGGAVANFNVATNESWTDKSGQKQEKTEWHRVVVWGKLAELCGQYLAKGRQAYVEGRLQTREWTDKEGQKRYTTEINAVTVQFLGGPGDRASAGNQDFSPQQQGSSEFSAPSSGGAPSSGFGGGFEKGESNLGDDEVPF